MFRTFRIATYASLLALGGLAPAASAAARVSANSARRLQRAWVVTRDRERSSIALQTTDRDKP